MALDLAMWHLTDVLSDCWSECTHSYLHWLCKCLFTFPFSVDILLYLIFPIYFKISDIARTLTLRIVFLALSLRLRMPYLLPARQGVFQLLNSMVSASGLSINSILLAQWLSTVAGGDAGNICWCKLFS